MVFALDFSTCINVTKRLWCKTNNIYCGEIINLFISILILVVISNEKGADM